MVVNFPFSEWKFSTQKMETLCSKIMKMQILCSKMQFCTQETTRANFIDITCQLQVSNENWYFCSQCTIRNTVKGKDWTDAQWLQQWFLSSDSQEVRVAIMFIYSIQHQSVGSYAWKQSWNQACSTMLFCLCDGISPTLCYPCYPILH